MDEEEEQSLDAEYNRFLHIMKPYLDQILNKEAIEICNAWIHRLSSCKHNEKILRNKYIFALCYQLAKGTLEDPFVHKPESFELPLISYKIINDESSSELEYINMDLNDTKILYNNKLKSTSTEGHSYGDSGITVQSNQNTYFDGDKYFLKTDLPNESMVSDLNMNVFQDKLYNSKAKNLIIKLREIKQQNLLLHKELYTLKEENKIRNELHNTFEEILKIDTSTSAHLILEESTTTLRSLKCKLEEVQESRNELISTISELKSKLDNYDDMKKYEIDDIQAKHKLEIIQMESSIREEMKIIFAKELAEVKLQYDESLKNIEQSKLKEIDKIVTSKDEIISQKDKIIESKNADITQLKSQIHEFKNNQQLTSLRSEKTEDIEKCFNKLEKSKMKYCRAYEAKLIKMKKDKQIAEYSFSLQLAKQRAQMINDITDEHQVELSTALDKLENKYKAIVANVQATAVQRRLQDQLALESIIKTICDVQKEELYNTPRATVHIQATNKDMNIQKMNNNCDIEIPIIIENRSQAIKDGSVVVGKNCTEHANNYSVDSEKLVELFDKAYIPQRDLGGP